ncbi:uncharacterized protein LOC133892890 [Phragmites australis]|uniref:uncharacterized protein LOC133892890 n=1 Tax=Phragmites australis TaxID=29695 RepID=UPI002D76B493|nr:uncharacterized protein LOC133892890 [Phragmites australis]
MGNCLERHRRGRGRDVHCAEKRAVWVVEEEVLKDEEEEEEEETRKSDPAPAPAAATTEVKIRITRKQLEELLRHVEDGKGGGVPVGEVVSELLCVASSTSNFRHRGDGGQWRPSLQSIQE